MLTTQKGSGKADQSIKQNTNLKLESPVSQKDLHRNYASTQSQQNAQSQLSFKPNTLQYNPSTQNLMINLANHTLNQIQTSSGYQSATNATSVNNLSNMAILGNSLTPHSGQQTLNPQAHFINLTAYQGNKNQQQVSHQAFINTQGQSNNANLLSGQKQQPASKSSMSTLSNGPIQNQNPNGSSGNYSSLASHSKKQNKPQLSSYNSIKNLRNEVKSLFEHEDHTAKSTVQSKGSKGQQQQQQTVANNDGNQFIKNSNQIAQSNSNPQNFKNPQASSRSTATHQYSMSSLSQHQPNSQQVLVNPSQYESQTGLQASSQTAFTNSKAKAQASNTFIQFGKKNSLRQNSESMSNQNLPNYGQQQNSGMTASQSQIASNYMNSQQQYQQSLQERQKSVDQDYMQYIQNFTIQDADGINQYGGNDGANSSQMINRAMTSSPPASQHYNPDNSVLRIQTGLFSPGTQSKSAMTHHIMPQTTVNAPISSQSALGGSLTANGHPITTKNGHSKKVSYFGTKAPTFKVQNSITKSQSNKNLINDKFQSQGFQLAHGNNPLQSQMHPQMSVSNLLLARAGGQIVNGINTSQPLTNQNFFTSQPNQQNSMIYNQNEQSSLLNQHNPMALSQKIHQHQDIKMIELINSQAKKPYESKGKKSIMNESSQMIAVHVETLPSQSMYREGQLVHYVQSRTALDNYRQSTELNFYQKQSQSLANSNENISRANEVEGTFCSMKDSLQYVVSDEGILAHQQEVHDLQQSIEKESALKRKKFSTDNQAQLQVTPIGKNSKLEQLNGQGKVSQRPAHQFNQTILQPTMTANLFSPGDNMSGSALQIGANTSIKNKTQKLNKMLKTLISDNNIVYNSTSQKSLQTQNISQIQQSNNVHQNSQQLYSHSLSQPNLHAALQNQNANQANIIGVGVGYNSLNGGVGMVRVNSKLQVGVEPSSNGNAVGQSSSQAGGNLVKKDLTQSKTAIVNFKKQSKGVKGQSKQQINIQSSVKPNNQHKIMKNPNQAHKDYQSLEKRRTPVDNYNTVQNPIAVHNQPIQIDLYKYGQISQQEIAFQDHNQQFQLNQQPGNLIGDQLRLMLQIEGLRKEVEDLKNYKLQAISKDKEIQHLKKKLQTVGQEKARLRNQVSANRAGGVGGLVEQSSGNLTSGGEITSTSKKVDRSAISSGGGSRQYAKPFQQLVSHIKSKARNQMSLDSQAQQEILSPQMNSQTKELMGLPIINENLIKSLNQQNFSTRNRKPHQSNNGVTSGHRLLNGNQMHVQSQPLLISPAQIVSGVGLVNSPSVANGLNNLSSISKNQMKHFSKQFQDGKILEEGIMRLSSPVFSIEDQSPPLKLKRVVSQRSIDSVSNYSSSQQKRENLRYKRSHDEYGNQGEDRSGDQSTLDKPKQLTEDMNEPTTCLEYVLPESVSIQQKCSTLNTSDIKIAQGLLRLNSSQIQNQQKLDTDSLEQTSELRTIPHSARLPINTSNETARDFGSLQELDNLKNRVGSVIQNYRNYIRYLENKVRRLEEKETSQV